jgi:hypothetical protein
VKLPPFNGKETWVVWFNRFKSVAKRRGRSEDDCLDELLPRLEGPAGDFVFEQLPADVAEDFRRLVKELQNRFRKVESSRTFGARFSSRGQKVNESLEEYAAELKRLYDKAHTRRDPETRQHDLLRRFLDGLQDESARFEIEYFKTPNDIDEAVSLTVEYLETRKIVTGETDQEEGRRPRKAKVAVVEAVEERPSDEDSEAVRMMKNQGQKDRTAPQQGQDGAQPKPMGKSQPSPGMSEMNQILEDLRSRLERLEKLQDKADNNGQASGGRQQRRGGPKPNPGQRYQGQQPVGGGNNFNGPQQQRPLRFCYDCGDPSHFKRECPHPLPSHFKRECPHPLKASSWTPYQTFPTNMTGYQQAPATQTYYLPETSVSNPQPQPNQAHGSSAQPPLNQN